MKTIRGSSDPGPLFNSYCAPVACNYRQTEICIVFGAACIAKGLTFGGLSKKLKADG
jgi:hypothetical protein